MVPFNKASRELRLFSYQKRGSKIEFLISIAIIIVIIILIYAGVVRIDKKDSKHKERHFQVQRDSESKAPINTDVCIPSAGTTVSHLTDTECCAYLDVETTSLDPSKGNLTVIGLYLEEGNEQRIVQLVGSEISSLRLIQIMKKVKVLYTYNGKRFDLPYIKAKLAVDLTKYCTHKDLMYECWRRNLYGGFKEVERKLGIKRKLSGMDGRIAVQLWRNYEFFNDRDSLTTLLEYNEEDVSNLRVLRQKLKI